MDHLPDIVICGAGIAGISCAYHLAVRHGVRRILLVDERPPLSLTSDKSTECYRNWWPDPAMVALMNRSIDLMETLAGESGNAFQMNWRGYLYVTADEKQAQEWLSLGQKVSGYGAGELRVHRGAHSDYQPATPVGYTQNITGADLILDPALLRKHFPYLTSDAVAALHARRAGWLSAQQLGMLLLEQARAQGVELVRTRLMGVKVHSGRVQSVELDHRGRVNTGCLVNAARPLFPELLDILGLPALPVSNTLHLKATISDTLGIVPRDAPLLIWSDPQQLAWSTDEQEFLAEESDTRWLLDELPAGAHTRPEGSGDSPTLLMLWQTQQSETQPDHADMQYAEIALRGLVTMLPGLSGYLGRLPRAVVDGGYYTHTPENRPLIGPLGVEGAYACGAFSGYGVMAALAAGEILAAQVMGTAVPEMAQAFLPARYKDADYMQAVQNWGETGQL